MTKELVELHHGTIGVASEPGKGTVFTVILPISGEAYTEGERTNTAPRLTTSAASPIADAYVPAPATSAPEEVEQGEKPVVLVVEDNADVRAYLREHLLAEYAVLEAENGRGRPGEIPGGDPRHCGQRRDDAGDGRV